MAVLYQAEKNNKWINNALGHLLFTSFAKGEYGLNIHGKGNFLTFAKSFQISFKQGAFPMHISQSNILMDKSSIANTLLKSDVTRRDHVSIAMKFHSQFHSRWYSLHITLKYTTLVHMRSGYA